MADNHRVAYLAVLHALALKLFYSRPASWPVSCLQIEAQDTLVAPFDGLGDFKAAKEIEARHQAFEATLPQDPADLWDYLMALDDNAAHTLFAHCAGLTINAIHDPVVRGPGKREHALRLATALNLDMSEQGFVAEAPNFFGRVTKATILASVAEAKGEETANLLADLKKKDMAAEASVCSRHSLASGAAAHAGGDRRGGRGGIAPIPGGGRVAQQRAHTQKSKSDPSGRVPCPPVTHVRNLEMSL